ncbi:MAG: hypothetical protein A3J48_02030 [Candidatus Doudnabacteria bacterium RIFCSPHIGHO2_02_FULL_46_11]|uniref:GOLD domain-containing protein n=1 Tax=Candidatus Doudnabacteria bacterium RIFCSPHIGHO2_02_FULL_46_11 TaxID=1817832 RepID=A0A1F5P504_9BACT|nr:MAG: hypothetical protein A3J48_02030 [Candidatus Doudnabacteria bacterium RIFCSPHIGHO2_02_FULL_46_11]
MVDLFTELKSKPHHYKLSVSFLTTLAAAFILVPLWLWSANHVGLRSQTSETSASENRAVEGANDLNQITGQISQGLSGIENPISSIDSQLEQTFSNPASITSLETVNGSFIVYFKIQNSTFADLTVPVARINFKALGAEESILVEKVTNGEGRQFVPLLPAGESAEGRVYFSQVLNGSYELTFEGLHYQNESQGEFNQVLEVEVVDSWQPRG